MKTLPLSALTSTSLFAGVATAHEVAGLPQHVHYDLPLVPLLIGVALSCAVGILVSALRSN